MIRNRLISVSSSFRPAGPMPARRGFTLIEMLSAVVLLSMFLVLSNQLFMATVRISHDAPVALAADVPVDAFRTQLTRDVWNAAAMEATDEKTLLLQLPAGGHIIWQYTPGKLTRVTAPAAETPRQYHGLAPVHFAVRGSIVACTLDPPAPSPEPLAVRSAKAADSPLLPGRAATFTFQSQFLLEARP